MKSPGYPRSDSCASTRSKRLSSFYWLLTTGCWLLRAKPAAWLSAVLLLTGLCSAQPKAADIKFRDVDIRSAFQVMARLAGRNLLLAPEVKGRLSLDLTGVDPLKAIDLIAAVNRYEVLVKDGVILIGDPATMGFVRGAGTVEIVPLVYGNSAELADKLAKLYKGKLDIIADPRTNSLLIARPGK